MRNLLDLTPYRVATNFQSHPISVTCVARLAVTAYGTRVTWMNPYLEELGGQANERLESEGGVQLLH